MNWLILAYLGLVTSLAHTLDLRYLLFPELGALAYDVLRNPHGRWAQSGTHLVTMPTVAAFIGILALRVVGPGLPALLVATAAVALLLRLSDSPMTPALSAALLAIVLQTQSFWYPLSVLAGTGALAILLAFVRRTRTMHTHIPRNHSVGWNALLATTALIVLTLTLGTLTGLRLLFFPPLAVIALETFGHDACPWRLRRDIVPIALTLTALLATGAILVVGQSALAALIGVAGAIIIQKLFKLSMPPLMAVALLPNLLTHSVIRYPLAIAGGSALLWIFWWLKDQGFNKPQPPINDSVSA